MASVFFLWALTYFIRRMLLRGLLASLIWLKPFFCLASAAVRSSALCSLSLSLLLHFLSLSLPSQEFPSSIGLLAFFSSYFFHLCFHSCSYPLLFPSLIIRSLALCHQAHPHFKDSLNPKSPFLSPSVFMITFYSLSSSLSFQSSLSLLTCFITVFL